MKYIKVRSQKSEVRSQNLLFCILASVFCILFFTGCATSKPEVKKEEPKKIAIEKISVIEDGKGVLIEASGNITYTAFKLSDPTRLVLDIPGVDVEKVREPIKINNELITSITAASYGEKTSTPIARIEIGLKEAVVYDVKQGEGSIMVKVNHEAPVGQEAQAAVESSQTAEATRALQKAAEPEVVPATAEPVKQEAAKQEEPKASVAEETKTAPPAAEKKEAKKADRLLRIEASKEDNTTIIKVVGNGAIGDFNAFDISKPMPPRLVVDVWNVKSSIPKAGLSVNTAHIKRVRVGEYPNKIRLVFDANQKTLPPYAIERLEDSLIITAGKVDMKKQEAAKAAAPQAVSEQPPATAPSAALQKAPEPAAAAIAEQKPAAVSAQETYAEVKGIDFKQLTDKARLSLTLSKKAPYQLSKSSDETSLVVDIKGAVIPDELKKTLDASELNTPVVTISSFQSPVEPAKDVRIIVKLKEKSNYDISQEGEKIQIDFPLQMAVQAVPKKAEAKTTEVEKMRGLEDEKKISTPQPLTPPTSGPSEQAAGYTGRKISLDFKDADISNILRLMAEVSNLNIIAGEDVKGKVSLRLIDVPWDQAFEIILKTNGLGRVQEGNVVRILPLAKIKQESEEALASKKAKEKLEDLETAILPVNYAKASELEAQIKGVLSDRGTLTTETRTNQLIIKDIHANIGKATDLLKRLDTQTPQVLIEARIVEANSNFARDLGVQWGAATATRSADSFNSVFGSTSVSPPQTLTPTGFIGSGGKFSAQPTYAVSLPASGSAGPLGALGFSFGTLTGDPFLLDLRISAGEKNGLTKTISRPRITTLDNKEAKISQGDSVPFETTSSSGTQTQFIDATLELTVTPHITPDGSISMKINAKRNSIGSFRSASGTPSISKKEASTEIIVKDGETTVIGGIVVADKSDATSGIPFFKDIPVIGWLFKNNSASNSQTELLIFITPNIVKTKAELSPS